MDDRATAPASLRRQVANAGQRLIDYWIPSEDHAADVERLRHLRVAVSITLLGIALVPVMVIQHVVNHRFLLAIVLGLAVFGLMGMLWLIRTYGWTGGAGHFIVLLLSLSLLDGHGLYDPPILGPIVFPVIVTFVSGRRSGWLWCGIAIVVDLWQWTITEGDPKQTQAWMIGLILITVALTGIAHAFETHRALSFAQQEHAREQIQAAAEAKSRFLANISHEIRTPMNGVLGMLGILLDTPLRNDQRSYAQTAHASGTALLDLLNDILDYSKTDAGQMLLEATPFDFQVLVEDVLDQLAVSVGTKNIELVSRYVPGTPTLVLGDHGRIRQILLNLVSNAIKFTDEGHVLVVVEHTPRGDALPLFRCSVEDTGIGIPREKQALVFDVFQQVDGSTTRERAGTGLGLAIVTELVELMEGTQGLTSEPGRGSTFWFELPLPVAKSSPPERMPDPKLAGLRVMIVDDHQINRWVLKEQLRRWGFRTTQVKSGVEALRELRESAARLEPYALTIIDYQMPKMDGLQLARAIQSDATIRDTTLIMLSSITARPSAQRLQEVGIAAYLVKPVHRSDLMEALATAWARRDSPSNSAIDDTPEPNASPATLRAEGIRILVAEDNAVNQKVAQYILAGLGCRVDVAADGQEALEMIELAPYDLVLMDIQMPRIDGIQATQQIRERERESTGSAHLPIIAMTAHAMPEDRDRCFAAGMDGYLSKPVQHGDLVGELRRWTSAR